MPRNGREELNALRGESNQKVSQRLSKEATSASSSSIGKGRGIIKIPQYLATNLIRKEKKVGKSRVKHWGEGKYRLPNGLFVGGLFAKKRASICWGRKEVHNLLRGEGGVRVRKGGEINRSVAQKWSVWKGRRNRSSRSLLKNKLLSRLKERNGIVSEGSLTKKEAEPSHGRTETRQA